MICRGGVVMGYVLNLASDDDDRLEVIICPKNDVFSTLFLPRMTITTLSTFSTTPLTAVSDVKMTVTRSLNCHFRGHSIMTPSLATVLR